MEDRTIEKYEEGRIKKEAYHKENMTMRHHCCCSLHGPGENISRRREEEKWEVKEGTRNRDENRRVKKRERRKR